MVTAVRPETAEIWRWLDEVADPEIPVISVVDLGIVRDVQWAGDELVVTITPTYSGCPATQVIADDIRAALAARGVEGVRLETKLAPAWTTDWLSDKGREKLSGYGIAPPGHKVVDTSLLRRTPIACPRCGSARTSRLASFASTPCKALYRCDDCLEPFDYFKPH